MKLNGYFKPKKMKNCTNGDLSNVNIQSGKHRLDRKAMHEIYHMAPFYI